PPGRGAPPGSPPPAPILAAAGPAPVVEGAGRAPLSIGEDRPRRSTTAGGSALPAHPEQDLVPGRHHRLALLRALGCSGWGRGGLGRRLFPSSGFLGGGLRRRFGARGGRLLRTGGLRGAPLGPGRLRRGLRDL